MLKAIFSLTSIAILSQLVAYVLSPFLLIFFIPSDFEKFGIFISLTGILSVLCLQRRDILLSRFKSLKIINSSFRAILFSSVKRTLILGSFSLIYLLSVELSFFEALLIYPFLLFFNIYWLQIGYLFAVSKLKELAIYKSLGVILIIPVQILLSSIASGLIIGKNLVIGFLALIFTYFNRENLVYKRINLSRFNRYSKSLTLESLLNKISGVSIFLISPFFYNSDETGYLFFCYSLIFLPIGIMADNISKVYFRALSNKKIFETTSIAFLISIAISLFILLAGPVLAPIIFILFENDNWLYQPEIFSLLFLWAATLIIISPFQFLNIYTGKIQLNIVIQILLQLRIILFIYFGFNSLDFLTNLEYFVYLTAGLYLTFFIITIYFNYDRFKNISSQ